MKRNGFYQKNISDRIYRIIRIEGPSALGYLAAGEKNPINPVKKKKLKIESIQHSVSLKPVVSFSVKLPQWRG